jgi:hypothetical protein
MGRKLAFQALGDIGLQSCPVQSRELRGVVSIELRFSNREFSDNPGFPGAGLREVWR